MIKKTPRLLSFFLSLGLLVLAPRALSAASYQILAVSYSSGDAAIHIGSKVTVQMEVIAPTNVFSVSVTAATGTSLSLGSGNFATLLAPSTLYVSDGQRVWQVAHPGFGTPSITFGNADLLPNGPSNWVVSDYTGMANQSFTVVSGTLLNGLSPGVKTTYVDLGAFAKIDLKDDPTVAGVAYDGIWTGVYNVQDLGFIITGARFFGVAGVDGIFASNQPFQSVQTIDIDSLLPAVETYQFSTNKPNYNGVLYLSRSSQGNSNFQPDNAQGRFDFTVNKRGVVVDIRVKSPTPKDLPSVNIPPSSPNRNAWNTWDGTDGNNQYLADGTYDIDFYIRDLNGVLGVSRTTQVNVSSLRMTISNITLSPSSLQTEPAFTNGTITRLTYKVTLDNDSPGTSLNTALAVFGFNPVIFEDNTDPYSWVYHLSEIDFLRPDGSIAIAFPGYDQNVAVDSDVSWLYFFRNTTFLQLFPNCYFPSIGPGSPLYTTTPGPASVGDGIKDNDVDLIYPLRTNLGTTNAPQRMVATPSIQFLGDTPAAGSYRLRLRSLLSGLEPIDVTGDVTAPDVYDYCSAATTPVFFGRRWHFVATAKPQGYFASTRGLGFNVEDNSVIFSVSQTQPPTSDTTAPVVVTSDPLESSEIEPGIYSSTKPLTVQIQDNESSLAVDAARTNLKLYHINSAGVRVPVGGDGNPDGGNPANQMMLFFKPNSPISTGGNYVLQINACNVNGLCISKDIIFRVQDQAAPNVVGIELKLGTQSGTVPLTLFQTASDGPFDNVQEIRAQLAMPLGSSNTIDWASSNISLIRYISNTASVIDTTRLTSLITAPTDGKLRYSIDVPIDYAGEFEVRVQTFALDDSGNAFAGPDSTFKHPRFTTAVNSNVFKLVYPFPSDSTYVAVSGVKPLTITSQGMDVTQTSLSVVQPDYTQLANAVGYLPLTATAGSAHGFRFVISGSGAITSALRFTYDAGTTAVPVQFKAFYSDDDLIPLGISKSALTLLGYTGSDWTAVSNVQHDSSSGTRNSFTANAPQSQNTYLAYGIFYTVPSSGPGALPTATAVPFKHTRSFNPVHRNPIYRMARFFYSDRTPTDAEARVYDSGGTLVRVLSVGNGIDLANVQADAAYGVTYHYFDWDGRNDSGTMVRNGLYLVRWKVTRMDGSSETMVKPVALIK